MNAPPVRLALLQTDSSHAEVYQCIAEEMSERVEIATIWGEDPAQVDSVAHAGVKRCATVGDALADIDGAMICGRWGETHVDPALAALAARRPVYIDKPLTESGRSASDLVAAYTTAGVPLFSASPLRFARELEAFLESMPDASQVLGGSVTGLGQWLDFGERGARIYFYGVHAMEIVSTLFGPGITAVRSHRTERIEMATLRYADGRLVSLELIQEGAERYEATVIDRDGTQSLRIPPDSDFYVRTLEEVVAFVETGVAPVAGADSVEIIRVLEAVEAAREVDGWVHT